MDQRLTGSVLPCDPEGAGLDEETDQTDLFSRKDPPPGSSDYVLDILEWWDGIDCFRIRTDWAGKVES